MVSAEADAGGASCEPLGGIPPPRPQPLSRAAVNRPTKREFLAAC